MPAPRARRGTPFTEAERADLLARFRAAHDAAEAAELSRPERDSAPFRREMWELAQA